MAMVNESKNRIYLDNAATSWPKPETVIEAMSGFMRQYAGSPGRSAHQFSIASARVIYEARALFADFFKVPDSSRVIFTSGATAAINMALRGLIHKGDHVVCSSMEHNSVIRPLRMLEAEGLISVSIAEADPYGYCNAECIQKVMNPRTALVILTHASNVNGCINPVREIGQLCRERKIKLVLDAAQTAGLIPISLKDDFIDVLIFSGHKKLMGPQGTGGMCINSETEVNPVFAGGTGSHSEWEEQPDFYPDKLEAGTPNTPGIAGLMAGLRFVIETGQEKSFKHVSMLTQYLKEELSRIEGIKILESPPGMSCTPIVSFNMEGISSSDLAGMLDRDYSIMLRAGLHCSPLAHKSLGSFPDGSLRAGIGYFNTEEEIGIFISELKKIKI
jgi:cysteine desulfurase family protein